MARVLESFGAEGQMWHRNDDIPDELVLDAYIRNGWVEAPTPPKIETATAAPGEIRSSGRKAPAKKTTKKATKTAKKN